MRLIHFLQHFDRSFAFLSVWPDGKITFSVWPNGKITFSVWPDGKITFSVWPNGKITFSVWPNVKITFFSVTRWQDYVFQFDQMARLLVQYLAICNVEDLQNSKTMLEVVQNFGTPQIKNSNFFPEFHQIWSHCFLFFLSLSHQLHREVLFQSRNMMIFIRSSKKTKEERSFFTFKTTSRQVHERASIGRLSLVKVVLVKFTSQKPTLFFLNGPFPVSFFFIFLFSIHSWQYTNVRY